MAKTGGKSVSLSPPFVRGSAHCSVQQALKNISKPEPSVSVKSLSSVF